jgi:hypothetical protein
MLSRPLDVYPDLEMSCPINKIYNHGNYRFLHDSLKSIICKISEYVKIFGDPTSLLLAFFMRMETVRPSETPITFYKTTRCQIPEDNIIQRRTF